MTSGYPRRRSRWESSFANPRSWYGRSRRASIASPTVTFPAFRSRRSACTRRRSTALTESVPTSRVRDGAEGAAPLDLLANPVLPLEHVEGPVRHLDRLLAGHDDQPGLIPDDPVAGVDLLPAALDLAPDLPEAFRFSRVRGHVSAEAREVQLEDRIEVPHRAINHDAGDALHEARVRRELAPDRRRPTADVDHDDVAGLRAIDRLDGFRPVAIRGLDGQRPAHELRAMLDPRHEARHHASFLHRIREVRCGDLAERVAHIGIRVLLVEPRGDRFSLV